MNYVYDKKKSQTGYSGWLHACILSLEFALTVYGLWNLFSQGPMYCYLQVHNSTLAPESLGLPFPLYVRKWLRITAYSPLDPLRRYA